MLRKVKLRSCRSCRPLHLGDWRLQRGSGCLPAAFIARIGQVTETPAFKDLSASGDILCSWEAAVLPVRLQVQRSVQHIFKFWASLGGLRNAIGGQPGDAARPQALYRRCSKDFAFKRFSKLLLVFLQQWTCYNAVSHRRIAASHHWWEERLSRWI